MYSDAIFYVDDGSVSGSPGSDAVRATLSGVVFANPSGETVRGNKVAHGLIDGAVVTVSGCTSAYANDRWKVLVFDADNFDLVGAFWSLFTGADVTGDVVPAGGSSWSDAWATVAGAVSQTPVLPSFLSPPEDLTDWEDYPPSSIQTSTRVQPGDVVRLAKTSPPTSIGNALWSAGPVPNAKVMESSTNATPIVVTVAAHGFVTGQIVRISGHTVNTRANGTPRVTVLSADTFSLQDPVSGADIVGNGVGGGTGRVRVIDAQVVELTAAENANISRCETAWSVQSGFIETLSATPTFDGTGYTAGDMLTILTGSADAVAEVLSVTTEGPVVSVGSSVSGGSGYSDGDVVVLMGGGNNCQCSLSGPFEPRNVTLMIPGSNYAPGYYSFTGGSGFGGLIEVVSVDAGAVLTVSLATQSVLGGYTPSAGKSTSGGTGTGCTLDITDTGDGGTATLTTGALGKQGDGFTRYTVGLPAGAIALVAFQIITLTDLSAYQELSFWLRTETVGGIATSAFRLCLCSDFKGDNPIDIIDIPATTVLNRWIPMSLPRTGGGNLGASIRSIALYSNTGSIDGDGLQLDCIVAAKAGGLCLRSTISQSGLATPASSGTPAPVYLIDAIDGPLVFLGSTPTASIAPWNVVKLGHVGETETVVTYQRRGIAASPASVTVSGAAGRLITFSGGWDTASTVKDGETVHDGITGVGAGLSITGQYIGVDGFTFQRYDRGMVISGALAHGNVLAYASFIGITGTAIRLDYAHQNTITRCAIFSAAVGIDFENCSGNVVGLLQAALQCAIGVRFSFGSARNVVSAARLHDCWIGCWTSGDENLLSDATFVACFFGVRLENNVNLGRRLAFNACDFDVLPWLAERYQRTRFQVEDYANTGQSRSFERGAEIASLATDRPGGSGLMWRTSFPIYSWYERPTDDPVLLPVAKVPLVSGVTVSIEAIVRKSHASNVAASLQCVGGQIAGIATTLSATATASTEWQVLTLSLTPTAAGVVGIILSTSRLATGAVGYVDIDHLTIA